MFPKEIDTYFEPFIGGASVLYNLLHTDIKVNKYICSDINDDLISLWNTIKDTPEDLIDDYIDMWNGLNVDEDIDRKKEYYYEVRRRFNLTRNPSDFLFLSRTCTNGLIRYNSKGEFNTSLHITRDGIRPEFLAKIIIEWHNKINEKNVSFICKDYSLIKTDDRDFLYLDPPYANTDSMYFGKIDLNKFWDWIRNQKAKYILSFDGKRDNKDNTFDVPNDIYSIHEYMKAGRSSFISLAEQKVEYVRESLYIK